MTELFETDCHEICTFYRTFSSWHDVLIFMPINKTLSGEELTMLQEITIQFTEQCNANCIYCFAPQKSNKSLSENNFNIFKTFCGKNRPDVIHITGGEPTLNPNFAEFVTQLAEISSLVIYTNFMTANMMDTIYVSAPSDIVFLVNTTRSLFCSDSEKEIMESNIQKALKKGFRVALSYTFFDIKMPLEQQFEYLIEKMRCYHLRNLRLSQALDFNDQNNFLDKNAVKSLYHYVAERIEDWRNEGFSVYFDCPIPPCYIEQSDFKTLRNNNATSIKCIPKVFVMWNLDVTHCYSTMGQNNKKKLMDFQSLQKAKEYSASILKKMQDQSNRLGCCKCQYGKDGIPCGCPSYCV